MMSCYFLFFDVEKTQEDLNNLHFRKVFLGHKKTIPSKLYAIKVMKKEELVNKNLKKQGKVYSMFTISLYCKQKGMIDVI